MYSWTWGSQLLLMTHLSRRPTSKDKYFSEYGILRPRSYIYYYYYLISIFFILFFFSLIYIFLIWIFVDGHRPRVQGSMHLWIGRRCIFTIGLRTEEFVGDWTTLIYRRVLKCKHGISKLSRRHPSWTTFDYFIVFVPLLNITGYYYCCSYFEKDLGFSDMVYVETW